jgi:hypothetical protein
MENLIQEFNQIGDSILNIEEVIKNWNNSFSISGWVNENEEKYRLIVHSDISQEQPDIKTKISKEQAFELINKLNLIKASSSTFRSGCSWHKKDYYHFEINRLNDLIKEKSCDKEFIDALDMAKDVIRQYLRLI